MRIVVIICLLFPITAWGQTHTMPGSNVVPSGSSLTIQSGATITAAGGSTVTGFGGGGGGNVSNSGTPTVGQKALWTDATHIQGVTDTSLQWDGGNTGLVASTGRSSLGLIIGTNVAPATSGTSILKGSGSGGFSNAASGTDYEVPLTFSTGLTRSTNTVTVNTSQNIATLSNLTTNGFVKTGGSVGTLSVDTATYQASDADLTSWAAITRASGFDTFATTSTSANLRTLVTDDNGTGALLFSGATTPDFTTGFTVGAAAATGKIMQGNGTNYIPSTMTWPSGAAPTTGKILQSNGTNIVATTETYPAPGTSGNMMVSDGTNWTSVARPPFYVNASGTGAAFTTTNALIPGSTVTIPTAGGWIANGQYRCVFDMSKTAGTGGIVLNVHMGTLGTTGDAIVAAITLAAGTSVADSGVFNMYITFKSVGSGTSAVINEYALVNKILTTTGLSNNGSVNLPTQVLSSGFNSTTQTKISIGFNGGTAFAGTNTFCQAEYRQ